MHFTIEDYKKIERWLKENSVKDTEFPETSDLYPNEYLTIIQQGINKKVKLNSLLEFILNSTDSDLDIASTNPVQNQAVTKAIYELQNRNIIKIVDTLPSIDVAESSIIYILLVEVGEDNNLFTEWIKVNNTWEKVGEFKADIDLTPYLKIEDSPFEKGSAEHSAILKGEYQGYSNKAISQTSMAVGAGTTAGLKGWYYRDYTGNIITILTTQPSLKNGHLTGGTPASESDVKQAFKVGDVVSFVNYQKYDKYAKVTSVQGNTITLDKNIALSEEVTYNDIDDWSIFLSDKPHLGAVDFGFGAFSEGGMSKSTNVCSHAEGFATEAYGQFSHTEGKETEAAYAAHAEGVKTKAIGNDAHAEGHITIAKGDHSHAEGRETIAEGYGAHAEGLYSIAGIGSRPTASIVNDAGRYAHAEGNGTQASGNSAHSEGKHTLASGNFSHAEGFNSEATEQCAHAEGSETHATKLGAHAEGARTRAEGVASHAEGIDSYANGRASHTEGLQTRAYNESEHASGKYNQSTKSDDKSQATHFSIGIGTSDTDRKNAFEVKQNGDIYIEGVDGKIQDKLNGGNAATPDWEANEEEEGFIKNKPFSKEIKQPETSGDFTYSDYDESWLLDGLGNFSEFIAMVVIDDEGDEVLNIFKLESGQTKVLYNIPYDGDIMSNVSVYKTDYAYYIDLPNNKASKEYVSNCIKEVFIKYIDDKVLPDTIARTEELEELQDIVLDETEALWENVDRIDEEISNLSKEIENLPSGESSVFEAVYGETTYEEIVAAHNSGKIVTCTYENMWVTRLARIQTSRIILQTISETSSVVLYCNNKNVWQMSTKSHDHELKTLDNGNAQITIAGKTAEVVTPQNVSKQGVIRQTQTWTQAADKGYDYVMQDIVRGSIPSHFIDLWKSRGGNTATFNEATGYFEYEYLKDISYEEALFAYSLAVPRFDSYQFANFGKGRLLLPQASNGGANGSISLNTLFTRCETFECIGMNDLGGHETTVNTISTAFYNCTKLKVISGTMSPKNVTTLGDAIFNNCYSLEEVRLKQIKASIGFAASARLSKDSVLYMIQNAQASPDITIKLHPDVYNRLEGDADIVAALAEKTNVSLASA